MSRRPSAEINASSLAQRLLSRPVGVRRRAEQQQDHEKSLNYLLNNYSCQCGYQLYCKVRRSQFGLLTCLTNQLHYCLGGFLQENTKKFGHIGVSTYIGRGYEAGCGVVGDWRLETGVFLGLVMGQEVGGRIGKTSGSQLV